MGGTMALAGGRTGERGSVAVLLALALTALLGFAALVVDVGLSWAARAEAQTAADAAALAGAARLGDGPAGVVAAVRQYLDANVPGLADRPADPDWPLNGSDDDGEVVCWTPPAPPPAPGAGCPDGSTAVQVTTPPIVVEYAFASVLGPAANSIRALAAAAGGLPGPAGLTCGLCLLDPIHRGVLAVAGSGDVAVDGGGVTVDSGHADAAILSDSGDVVADQIDVVGGVAVTGSGRFIPPPATGVPSTPDPLAALPTPDTLPAPPPCCFGRVTVGSDRTLAPGVYQSITVTDDATLTLNPGVYVLTELPGLAILENATVQGTGVTLYLTCNNYPTPCTSFGAGFTLTSSARYTATAPTSGPYANLTLFADRANPTPLLLATTADTSTATMYATNARLLLASTGDLAATRPLILARLTTLGTGSVRVALDTPPPVTGPSSPVLIR